MGLGILSITAYAFSVCAVGFLYDNRGLGSILTVLLAIGFLTAIAAVVLGHLGRRPPKCDLAKPGSARIGTVGLLMGYLGIVLPVFLSPALAKAKLQAQDTLCGNYLVQIYCTIARAKVDAETNGAVLSDLVGPRPNASPADGFDYDSWRRFRLLSNWVPTPSMVVCPLDKSRTPASDWEHLGPSNVTYRIYVTTNALDAHPQMELLLCPIHGKVVLVDGSIQRHLNYRRE